MTETYTICETCRERVERDESGVVEAVELSVPVGGFGSAADNNAVAEGMHVLFHETCFPHGTRRYRLIS